MIYFLEDRRLLIPLRSKCSWSKSSGRHSFHDAYSSFSGFLKLPEDFIPKPLRNPPEDRLGLLAVMLPGEICDLQLFILRQKYDFAIRFV